MSKEDKEKKLAKELRREVVSAWAFHSLLDCLGRFVASLGTAGKGKW
jgi:hypothetical protein|tara:strand:+ start:48 stop:188 length:141 start_codon:yes stop_codon:yes gene_type:complete